MFRKYRIRVLLVFGCFAVCLQGVMGQRKSLASEYIYSADSIVLIIKNNLHMPVYMNIEQKIPVGELSFDYISESVLPPDSDDNIAMVCKRVEAIDTAEFSFGDYFEFDFEVGDPYNSKHDKKYRYALPIAKGVSCEIIQGFNGSYSHSRPTSRYAIDFDMKIGDTVYAARSGIAGKVVEHFTDGGRDRDTYYGKDNHIAVLHEDGSIGYYVHLDENGALVDLGDSVEKGQAIGISGNTGWSTRPHLHFVVREAKKDGPVAVKINFETVKGKKLKSGKVVINN